ncbi:MAG TPA: hypothetical protein VNL77_01195 [Roseiflexaceae bacterium]|nr:hypothetical protein [Roseiflexaceae bacterium]
MIDEAHQRRARRLALGLGGLSLACLALAALALWLRPRHFTTHHDAIGYALAQRGIGYQAIYINHAWPDTVNNLAYGANLEVQLTPRRRVPGRLECRRGRTSCFFSVAGLGIVREPLPELVKARRDPWLAWVEQAWDALVR